MAPSEKRRAAEVQPDPGGNAPGALARVRLAIALISVSALALELSLMRLLSARFWHHAAYLVITVALLGFGASGTALTFLRRRMAANRSLWMAGLAAAFSVSTAVSARLIVRLPIEVHFLAWDPRQTLGILLLELLAFFPFLLAGSFVGAALMDAPERVGGHYAANLIGSGIGALAAVALMHVWRTEQLIAAVSVSAFAAAALLVPWRRPRAAAGIGAAGALLLLLFAADPLRPAFSAYKRITFETAAGAEILHEAPGPLGTVAVVAGPSVHEHPGLGWQYTGEIPPRVLILVDGDSARAVFDVPDPGGWQFMDHTTAAVAYALTDPRSVCLVGAGGGAEIGLALYHGATDVTALEMNRRVIEMQLGPLRDRGGSLFAAPGVTVLNREARGHLARTADAYDLIQVPPADAFGAAGGGLFATQESYLHTVESFGQMLDRLRPDGILTVTLWMQDPPRAGLRAFETLAEALRRRGLDPAPRLAMIRNRTTVTVGARPAGFRAQDAAAIRRFCDERGFDLGYVPGMAPEEANRFHRLPRPYYYEAAQALLGPDREAFLHAYLFLLSAPTDDRPFFFHTFRWGQLGEFRRQLGGRVRAFLEPGYLMLLAAFLQAALLAVLFVLLPLAARRRRARDQPGRTATLLYFLMLGLGFLMLEMALLGRLILYLADPIYAASTVIAGFLVFAGLGSRLSERWRAGNRDIIRWAGLWVAGLGAVYAFGLGRWLGLSQGLPLPARIGIALATVAPLALGMGHLFPSGLRQVGRASPALVPWAWAVNGFASVIAAVGTPLLAMHAGYLRVGLAAAGCYAAAAWLGRRLPASP